MLITRHLDIADARHILAAAETRAGVLGIPMCTAVVDGAGVLIAFERMDGGRLASVSIAIDKAFTAAIGRNPTTFYADETNPMSPSWRIKGTNGGRFTTIGGGVPVTGEGAVVGAIGVSGGTVPQDIEVAEAALTEFLAGGG